MKKISFFFIFNLLFLCSFAQELKNISNDKSSKIEQALISKSKQIQSLQCDFVQEKTSNLVSEKAVSHGILQFKSPDFLRWEYTLPNAIALISNEKEISLINAKGEKKDAKTFRQLGNFITSAINGEILSDSRNFQVEYFEIDQYTVLVRLMPLNRRLKAYYEKIELKIDRSTGLAREIAMYEVSGDKTAITLKNHKTNQL